MTTNDIRDLYDLNRFGGVANVTSEDDLQDDDVDDSEAIIFDKYQLVNNALLDEEYAKFDIENTDIKNFMMGADLDQKLVLFRAMSQIHRGDKTPKSERAALNSSAINWAYNRAQTLAEFSRYYILYLLFSPPLSDGNFSQSPLSFVWWLNFKYNNAPQRFYLISKMNILGHNQMWRK